MAADSPPQRLGEGLLGGSATALGYDLWQNPEGFVLAVVWRALVDAIWGFANGVADRIYAMWTILDEAVIGGIASAVGAPGRAIASLVFGVLASIDAFATNAATALGPFGFIVVPILWAVAVVAAVSAIVSIWRLYKWIRVVVA